ncbi:hypothetical protein PHMEG_0009315 [Phytophthora megakarya]|uniref:Uncharacterized protein n=1 Tax=Phytophthora megakarya TaxID=4795 RepID=A0A225WH39_9STRA|nr:hypothetical protein PHMEG_0009315 [Phytophthora megakarya]
MEQTECRRKIQATLMTKASPPQTLSRNTTFQGPVSTSTRFRQTCRRVSLNVWSPDKSLSVLLLGAFSYKTGYAKDLMEMVHDGVVSPSGLARVMESIRRRRQTRYYKLYSIFCDRVRHLCDANPAYMVPSPPTYSQYCESNAAPSDQMISSVWLEMTMIWSSIAEKLMKTTKVKRIDHSVKFCKKTEGVDR